MLRALILALASAASAQQAPLTEAQSGATRDVRIGQAVTVALRVRSGTGYGWQFDGGFGLAASAPVTRRDARPGIMGGPATQVFRLRATHGGPLHASFSLRRPWEKTAAPLQVVTYTLVAR